jgi:hypothetical protein
LKKTKSEEPKSQKENKGQTRLPKISNSFRSKKLIEKHKGQVNIMRKKKRGCRFYKKESTQAEVSTNTYGPMTAFYNSNTTNTTAKFNFKLKLQCYCQLTLENNTSKQGTAILNPYPIPFCLFETDTYFFLITVQEKKKSTQKFMTFFNPN